MGRESQNPQKWTAEEEEALLAGVAKYGAGNWKIILEDSEFGSVLTHRSNMKLRDKWRRWSGRSRASLKSPSITDETLEDAESVSELKEEDRASETNETKRILEPAEDTEYMLELQSMLQLASEIYERFS